jgi:hypothetical protein
LWAGTLAIVLGSFRPFFFSLMILPKGMGGCLSFLCVAFADVAGAAEGLKVVGIGGAAFADGLDMVDMEGGAGLCGRGGAAGGAAEVVALHDEVADAPGDGAGRGGCADFGAGGQVCIFFAPLNEVLEGFEPGSEYAEVGFAAIAGVGWYEVGSVGLAAEGDPQVADVVEEGKGANTEFFGGLQAGLNKGFVPRVEFADVDGGVVVADGVVLPGGDGFC